MSVGLQKVRLHADCSPEAAVGSLQGHILNVFSPTADGNAGTVRTVSLPAGGVAPLGVAFDPTGNLYTALLAPGVVYEYAAGASGNAAPLRTITGSNTNILVPAGIAVDAGDNVYVANAGSANILIFGPNANGNVAPLRTIGGSATGIGSQSNALSAVNVDAAGYIYASVATNKQAGALLIFAPDANRNVAPVRTITGPHTGLDGPSGVAVDASTNLYAVNSSSGSVVEFPPGANGDAIVTKILISTAIKNPGGIAIDGQGSIYVADQSGPGGGGYAVFLS